MAAFGIAIVTRSETRLAMAAVLWFVLQQKVGMNIASLHSLVVCCRPRPFADQANDSVFGMVCRLAFLSRT